MLIGTSARESVSFHALIKKIFVRIFLAQNRSKNNVQLGPEKYDQEKKFTRKLQFKTLQFKTFYRVWYF